MHTCSEHSYDPLDVQLKRLKEGFASDPKPSAAARKEKLKLLKKQIQRYQNIIPVAIAEDFGWRAPAESKLIDALGPVLEINHALHSVKKWMKPQRRSTELLFISNSLKVTYQPKGVVGIICPWNFPLFLSLGPLIASFTAGNRAMIKMPPNCPRTTQLLTQLLGEVFSNDTVCVIPGDHPEAMEISHLHFDHIVFTGSPSSGKTIMSNAAQNLTPVTLELGGKSPAIVTRSYPLKDAAKRIAHGKSFNSGQVCLAPDYAFVPEDQVDQFVEYTHAEFLKMNPETSGNEHYTALVDAAQDKRFLELVADAESKGAKITLCGENGVGRKYPLHLVTNVDNSMRIAQEEIFGPLLPIIPYKDIKDAVHKIASGNRPLACYIFGHDKAERDYILDQTHSGGVVVNDWGWHAMNNDGPFGGVGNSGTGSYHGIEGFRELSHAKPVFKRHRFYPIGLFYPPYGTFIQQLSLKLFLGNPDESVSLDPVINTVTKKAKNENEDMLNLASNLVHSAKSNPDKVAIHFAEKSFTYAELDLLSNKVANGLKAMGIEPGDKVALGCLNLPYFPMVYYGILKAGAVVVPLNVLLKPDEIAYHLEDSEAKAYFCFEGTDELPMGEMGWEAFNQTDFCTNFVMITAEPAAPSKIGGARTLGLILGSQSDDAGMVDTATNDTAVILYTSGTTGKPKGAELTHSNMSMNAMASQILLSQTSDDVQLITLPLFHSFGQSVQMNAAILTGATMVLIPRFEAEPIFSQMEKHRITIFAGVPTMFIGLLNAPEADKHDLELIASNLRLAVSGGSSLPVEVIKQFEAKFKVAILEGYGLSETSPVATFNHFNRERIPGSIGQPIEGVSLKIVDEAGKELGSEQPGEIAIKGHNVMKGYLGRPEETKKSIVNGWFHTGDIGKRDAAGNYYIVDRLKEMIIRGGFNVYPREIEEVLMTHPSVVMVAVLGVPHATHGEEIKAYVVTKDGYKNEDELKAWAKERLADYKYPRSFEFRDQLPMTATGKLLKRQLKAEQK